MFGILSCFVEGSAYLPRLISIGIESQHTVDTSAEIRRTEVLLDLA